MVFPRFQQVVQLGEFLPEHFVGTLEGLVQQCFVALTHLQALLQEVQTLFSFVLVECIFPHNGFHTVLDGYNLMRLELPRVLVHAFDA